MTTVETTSYTEFEKLSRDIREATRTLNPREARYLVDSYYQMQEYRISAMNQARSMQTDGEPHETIQFFSRQMAALENQIKRVLDTWTDTDPLGAWAKSITGIGPVIAAGLLAHIDLEKATTAGKIWRYAGLDPTSEWHSSKECQELVGRAVQEGTIISTTGPNLFDPIKALQFLSNEFNRTVPNLLNLAEVTWDYDPGNEPEWAIYDEINWVGLGKKLAKRPWNASLKVICWKAGESFVKVSNNPNDVYGKMYIARKQYEIERNEAVEEVNAAAVSGDTIVDFEKPFESSNGWVYPIAGKWYRGGNAKAAWTTLQKKKIGKDTDAYAAYSIGKLPPAHIHARAKRYAVKIFLSHFHEMGYKLKLGKEPPVPYPIGILGHTDYIPPPNQDI